jgi:VanZ family protein
MNIKNILKAYTPAVIWAATIFVLSAVPGNKLYMPPIWNADKFAHSGVYFVLAACLIFGFLRAGHCQNIKSAILSAILISVVFGGILEILQQFVFVGRFGDLLDFTANSTGAILAGLFALLFRKMILRLCP